MLPFPGLLSSGDMTLSRRYSSGRFFHGNGFPCALADALAAGDATFLDAAFHIHDFQDFNRANESAGPAAGALERINLYTHVLY
jgi:hypothetical protein